VHAHHVCFSCPPFLIYFPQWSCLRYSLHDWDRPLPFDLALILITTGCRQFCSSISSRRMPLRALWYCSGSNFHSLNLCNIASIFGRLADLAHSLVLHKPEHGIRRFWYVDTHYASCLSVLFDALLVLIQMMKRTRMDLSRPNI
jgi:hypothetical protein